MFSNQHSNDPREDDHISDSLQTVDPLAQFPSEYAAKQPVKGNQPYAVASSNHSSLGASPINKGNGGPSLLAFLSENTFKRVVQLHPWTYPVGLFVSGIVVGAFLMTFGTPSSGSLPAVAAPVSADQTPASSSPAGALIATTPSRVVFADAPAAPDRPVPTGGIGSSPRLPVPRVQPEPRAIVPPGQSQTFQGSLQISSQPDGAAVFMNGQHVGTTPLVLQDLPIGSRVVRLTLTGYEPWSRAVQVVAYQRSTLTAALQASRNQ